MLDRPAAIGQERAFELIKRKLYEQNEEYDEDSRQTDVLGLVSIVAVNAGFQYWLDGRVSPIYWLGILLGTLLVTIVAVLGEMYWMSKSK